MNINLHIERIVLEGWNLNAHEREQLQQVLIENLVEILQTGSLQPELLQSTRLHRLPVSGISFSERNDALFLGNQMAQAIGNSLTQPQLSGDRRN